MHETDQAVLFHLRRAFVASRPHVADVLAIETPHSLPLEHVVLGSSLELSLLSSLLIEGIEARQRL